MNPRTEKLIKDVFKRMKKSDRFKQDLSFLKDEDLVKFLKGIDDLGWDIQYICGKKYWFNKRFLTSILKHGDYNG